ncbi:MAG: hypothetical protein ACEPOV_08540 [Hyphomicrobiales bacterium]
MKTRKLSFKKETIANIDSLSDIMGGNTNYRMRTFAVWCISDDGACPSAICHKPSEDCPTHPDTVCHRCIIEA